MSAYIVDHDHIDALLSFAAQHEVRYVAENSLVVIDWNNATEIGRILLDENERSVRHRYPGCAVDDLPGTVGEDSASYKFRKWPSPVKLDPLMILKACDGFDYQACETDDYDKSLAAAIVNAIRKYAVGRLPGYSNSPGWAMRRPVKA